MLKVNCHFSCPKSNYVWIIFLEDIFSYISRKSSLESYTFMFYLKRPFIASYRKNTKKKKDFQTKKAKWNKLQYKSFFAFRLSSQILELVTH